MSKLPKAIEQAEQIADQAQKGLTLVETAEVPEKQEAVVEAEKKETPPPQPDVWEQKYRILQGKYNAEVPRLSAQLREMQSEIESLKTAKPEALISEKDKEEYGESMIDMMRRAAREELAAKDSEIQELKRKLNMVEDITVRKTTDDFWAELKRAVPDWEAVNVTEGWLDWLGEVDEFAGRVRQDLLDEAQKSRNASRVAKFFNAYKQQKDAKQSKAVAALEEQIAPDDGAPASAPSSSKFITVEDLRRANMQAIKGKITQTELEKIHQQFLRQKK